MTNENKTAIQQAEKQLENERAEKLKNEIYTYLKQELELIDNIDNRIRKLSEEKRAHEENIKNIKQGNLKAIEERRKQYVSTGDNWITITGGYGTSSYDPGFYFTNIAGTTITTTYGKTYFF
jgi:hypothetical protein